MSGLHNAVKPPLIFFRKFATDGKAGKFRLLFPMPCVSSFPDDISVKMVSKDSDVRVACWRKPDLTGGPEFQAAEYADFDSGWVWAIRGEFAE
jgi:hypothetical protein